MDVVAAGTVWGAAFGNVMLLGVQSKLMRDNNWKASYFTSWMITVAQWVGVYAVAHSLLTSLEYLWWAGHGGSMGIVSAHFFYDWMNKYAENEPRTCGARVVQAIARRLGFGGSR